MDKKEKSIFEKGENSEEKISRVIAGSGISLTLGATGGIFYLVLFILLPRLLRPDKMGLYGAFIAIFWIGWALLSIGIPQAIAKYIPERLVVTPKKTKLFAAQGIRLLHLLGLVALLVGAGIIYLLSLGGKMVWVHEDIALPLFWPSISALVAICAIQLFWSINSILQGYQRLDLVAKNNFAFMSVGCLSAIALVVITQLRYGIFSLGEEAPPGFYDLSIDIGAAVFGFAIGGIIAYLLALFYLKRSEIMSAKDFFKLKSPGLSKQIVLFGGLATIGNVGYMIGLNLDLMVVGFLPHLGIIGSTEAGLYSTAHLYALAPMIVTPLAFAFLPAMAEAYANRDHGLLNKYFRYAFRYSLMVILPIIFAYGAMAKEIMVCFAGANYAEVGWIPFLIAIGTSLFFMFYLLMYMLFGLGKPAVPAWAILVGISLESVGIMVGSLLAGYKGVVLGFLLLGFSTFGITFIYLCRTYKLKLPRSAFLPPLGAAIPPWAIVYFLMPKTSYWILIDILIFIGIYCIFLILLGGIEARDLNVVRGWLSSITGKRVANKVSDWGEKLLNLLPSINWR
jgi:O-antigen/teichoic acid export membrane protein